MELLEGETLRDNIEKGGVWSMEDTVTRMSPIMETLQHMHADNVIHRDISPDNLMILHDGSLRLLDFGAAKQYQDSTLSRLVVKASYSPPEQMDPKGVFGSWSDVYSMCAAIYFCITGKNPEDAISRLLLDDLKKPSALGATILPDAEKSLMRGMALDSNERIRSMAQLRSELQKAYPVLTEEEKRALKKKKIIKGVVIAAATMTMAVAVLVYINFDSIRLAWHNAHGTETIILDGSNMSDEEFIENADKAEARIAALAGDNGSVNCKRIGHTIQMEIPAGLFEDPLESVDRLVSSPLKFYIVSDSEELLCDLLPEKDVVSVSSADNADLTLTFTKDAQNKLKDFLSQEYYIDHHIWIRSEIGRNIYVDRINYGAFSNGDGQTSGLILGEVGSTRFAEEVLTNEPLSTSFDTTQMWNVVWEDPNKSESPGEHQVREADFELSENKTDRLRLKYCLKSESNTEQERTKQESRIELSNLKTILKKRLDIINIPYAIGEEKFETESVIIDVPAESINYETAVILGMDMYNLQFRFGLNKFFNELNMLYDWLKYDVELADDGNGKFIRIIPENTTGHGSKAEILNFLNLINENGENDLYLSYMFVPVAKVNIKKAINSINNDGVLEFRQWCAADGKDEDLIDLVDLITKSIDQASSSSDGQRDGVLKGLQKVDVEGNVYCYDPYSDMIFSEEQRSRSYIDDWNDSYKNMLRFEGGECEGYAQFLAHVSSILYVYDVTTVRTDDAALERFCSFYKDNIDKLEDGTFDYIYYQIFCGGYDAILIMRDEFGKYYISNTKTLNIT